MTNKYGHRTEPAYTRREYIKKFGSTKKITKYVIGNTKSYTHELDLVSLRDTFIPDVVLESVRVAMGHALKKLEERFVFQIVPYPHHITREHAQMGIAKAERFQKGMRRSFGRKFICKSAHVKQGTPLVRLWIFEENIPVAKEALRIASSKIGTPTKVEIKKSDGCPNVLHREVEKAKEQPVLITAPKTDEEKKNGKSKVEKKGRVR